jgi:hypothetical protein
MHSTFLSSLTLGLLFANCFPAMAKDKPAPPSESQIRAWIEDLANEVPMRRFRSPSDRLTKQEREALEPVKEAYANFTKHFVAALPYLMESIDDKRYSYPQEHPSSGVFEHQSVGDACQSIIQRKVLLRNRSVIEGRGIAVWHDLPIDNDLYSRAKRMSLFEMQVDALNWMVKQGPPSFGVSRAEWNEELVKVRKFREEFIAKGKSVDESFGPAIEGK